MKNYSIINIVIIDLFVNLFVSEVILCRLYNQAPPDYFLTLHSELHYVFCKIQIFQFWDLRSISDSVGCQCSSKLPLVFILHLVILILPLILGTSVSCKEKQEVGLEGGGKWKPSTPC